MKTTATLLISTLLSLSAFLAPPTLLGQESNGIGLRFASNINYFPRANEHNLVPGGFTTGVFGIYYSEYTLRSGYEIGFNVVHKGAQDASFNLPVVMTDFRQGQHISMTALEMDLKVGPRWYALNPKIGYVLGYRLKSDGFLTDGTEGVINRMYLMLPFGLSGIWPTNFGTVGVGAFYNVGIFNVIKDPDPLNATIPDGGRHRYINIEIIVTYGR